MLLRIENLEKDFDGLIALKDITFEVEAGGITGIIGPNGAGKTTLFNVITGIYPATRGKVYFEGRGITGLSCHHITALGLVRTFQNVRPFKEMTVLENVLTGMHAGKTDGFLSASFRLPRLIKREKDKYRKVYNILHLLDLENELNKEAHALPFGQLRRLEIARALVAKPKLLLLDEPAAGLNRSETVLLENILRLINQKGITILLVEHDMRLVMDIADRLIVLDAGRIIASGPPDVIRQNPDVIRAYLGEIEA
jgi:branched-chain amino acid transport system ATP-binding protein